MLKVQEGWRTLEPARGTVSWRRGARRYVVVKGFGPHPILQQFALDPHHIHQMTSGVLARESTAAGAPEDLRLAEDLEATGRSC